MGIPRDLAKKIQSAHRELRLARQDGAATWIIAAARDLDNLLDQLPRKDTQ